LLAVAPLATVSRAPLLTVVPLSVPPENTNSTPPALRTVPVPTPPLEMYTLPPRTMLPLALPPGTQLEIAAADDGVLDDAPGLDRRDAGEVAAVGDDCSDGRAAFEQLLSAVQDCAAGDAPDETVWSANGTTVVARGRSSRQDELRLRRRRPSC